MPTIDLSLIFDISEKALAVGDSIGVWFLNDTGPRKAKVLSREMKLKVQQLDESSIGFYRFNRRLKGKEQNSLVFSLVLDQEGNASISKPNQSKYTFEDRDIALMNIEANLEESLPKIKCVNDAIKVLLYVMGISKPAMSIKIHSEKGKDVTFDQHRALDLVILSKMFNNVKIDKYLVSNDESLEEEVASEDTVSQEVVSEDDEKPNPEKPVDQVTTDEHTDTIKNETATDAVEK